MPTLVKVRVKSGTRYGSRNQYGPGDILLVEAAALRSFPHKLAPVRNADIPIDYVHVSDSIIEAWNKTAPETQRLATKPKPEPEPLTLDPHVDFAEVKAAMDRTDTDAPKAPISPLDVYDLTDAQREALEEAGLYDVERIHEATDEELRSINGIGPATLQKLRDRYGDA